MKWGPMFEYTLALQLVLSMFAQLSATPAWNLVLVFWGLYSYYSKNARALLIFMVVTAATIILDITWCGVYGPSIHQAISLGGNTVGSTMNFGLAMVILNMFAKFPVLFFARGLFLQNGGVWSVSQAAPGMAPEDAFFPLGSADGNAGSSGSGYIGGDASAGGAAPAAHGGATAVDPYAGGSYAAPAQPTPGGGYQGGYQAGGTPPAAGGADL